MNRVKLLILSISPYIISKLFQYVLKLDMVGMELSILSILFCVYWFYVGYKSYDYVESAKESILLGNSFGILCIVLVLVQLGLMGRYMPSILGIIPQDFFLPMLRISSWINGIIRGLFRFTFNHTIYHFVSFAFMMILYCCGYKVAKNSNESNW